MIYSHLLVLICDIALSICCFQIHVNSFCYVLFSWYHLKVTLVLLRIKKLSVCARVSGWLKTLRTDIRATLHWNSDSVMVIYCKQPLSLWTIHRDNSHSLTEDLEFTGFIVLSQFISRHELVNKKKTRWMDGWMGLGMDGWMDGWTINKWMKEWIKCEENSKIQMKRK